MDGLSSLAICYTRFMRILAASLIVAAVFFPALHARQSAASIEVPAGAQAVLQATGSGVQIYTCAATRAGGKWVFKAPEAKLLDTSGKTIGSHFAGPTWKLNDGSRVEGELVASKPSPDASSVPWLLLRAKAGSATGSLASVAFIRRTDTFGGVAPSVGCELTQDYGKTSQVPYTAPYTFYSGPAAK